MATFIDTLFVVGFTNRRDQYHEKALELSEIYDHRPLITTDAVLLEIGNTSSGKLRPQSIKVIENFLESEEIEVVRLDETLFNKAFELYKSHADKSWGLVDCISFVVMKENDVTDALICDKHFVQAGFCALMLDSVN